MKRNSFCLLFLLFIFTGSGLKGISYVDSEQTTFSLNQSDTIKEDQALYNGRIWKNLYYNVQEDQFLFSRMFLPGSLTIRGKTFKNISIMYDIYKDEILTPIYPGGILQLNKEMVDSFSISFQNKTHQFIRIPEDSLKEFRGYFNVIYKGKTALYVKYNKKIDKLGVEGKYDKFYQVSRIYFMKDNIVHLITNKSDLLKVLNEDKAQIKDFIRKNKLAISKNDPESFIPVTRYFDTLSH
ncbi:MAG: hypothetical protein WCS03_15080 [Bacteroidota bacterium]